MARSSQRFPDGACRGNSQEWFYGLKQFFAGVVKNIQHQISPARSVSQPSGKEAGDGVGHWPRLRIPRNGCQVRMLRSGYNIEPSEAGAFQSFGAGPIHHKCHSSSMCGFGKIPRSIPPPMFSVGYECARFWLQCQRIGLQDETSGFHDHHMKLAGGLLRIQGGRVG